ncbi:MAG: hypothetical protein RIR39_1962 [Pseudomonadota bacterium]|jgi:hypothetical protein
MSKDNKSSYYDAGGVETLDVIKAKLTKEQYQGYLLGNAIKYSCRMMHKSESPQRDAEKSANYSRWLAESFSVQQETVEESCIRVINDLREKGVYFAIHQTGFGVYPFSALTEQQEFIESNKDIIFRQLESEYLSSIKK